MISHNYSKRHIRPLLKEIGINKIREVLVVQRLSVREPMENFCLQRNEKGDFLMHMPTGRLILSLANYKVPKHGWTFGENYNKKE